MGARGWVPRRRDFGAGLVGFLLASVGAVAILAPTLQAERRGAEAARREAADSGDRAKQAEADLQEARYRFIRAHWDLGVACDAKRRAEAAARRAANAGRPAPGPVPDADWRLLSQGRWADDDPKAAWEQLDADWRWFMEERGLGPWTRIEVWFERRPAEAGGEVLLLVEHRQGTGRAGKFFQVIGARAEGRDQFLEVAAEVDGKAGEREHVRYEFKGGRLVLAGVVYGNGNHPTPLTGTYRLTNSKVEVATEPGAAADRAGGKLR